MSYAEPVKPSSRFIILTKAKDGSTPPSKVAVKKIDIASVEDMPQWNCRSIVYYSGDAAVNVTESFDEIMAELG